jgi:hypothetical protein
LVRLARRSLSACPQFLVAFCGMGTVWDVGCVLWCVGGTGGHGKNDKYQITNASFRMIFTDSYIGAVHLENQYGLFMPSCQDVFFSTSGPHPPAAAASAAPAKADCLQEQVGHAQRAQRLHDDNSPKGNCDEGECLWFPQVRGEVCPSVRGTS